MIKKALIAVMVLFMCQIASAELVIQPNPILIQVQSGVEQNFSMNLTNNLPYRIMDFQFSNLSGFTFSNITLEPNQTQTVNFSVKLTTAFTGTMSSIVSFKYLVELPEGVQTRNINITVTGYQPDFLIVRRGDTVQWNNVDEISRSVTGTLFDFMVSPNASSSYTFTTLGIFPYQDTVLFYGGSITVINETESQRVNNPVNDVSLSFNVDVTLGKTSLTLETDQSNYSVITSGTEEGLLTVRNNGSETAQRIRLTAEPGWILFDEDNFDIITGDRNLITYHVQPIVYKTEDTNKTYSIIIRAKGANTESVNQTISVFVPYNNAFADLQTNEGFLSFFKRFCDQNPSLIVCNNTLNSGGANTTIVRDPTIPVNLTARDFLAMQRRLQQISDSNTRTDNQVKELKDLIATQFPQMLEQLNNTNSRALEQQNTSDSRTRAFWIAALFFILICAVLIVGLYLRRYFWSKNINTGGYKFKY